MLDAGPDLMTGVVITCITLSIFLELLVYFFILENKLKKQQKLRVSPPKQQPGKVIDYPPPTGPVSSKKINAAVTTTIKKINSKEKNLLQSEAALILKKGSANTLSPAILVPDPYSTIIA